MSTPLKHYLQFSDLNASEYAYLFERAALIKKKFKAYEKHQPLIDRTMVMIFEKASTRTCVSFEAGMYQLGGTVVNLTTEGSQLGRAEPIEDSAKVISRMVDLVMIRTYGQDKIEKFAEHSRVPVINGLTNEFHPCQILADIFTYIEHRGSIQGRVVAWGGGGKLHACAEAADGIPAARQGGRVGPRIARRNGRGAGGQRLLNAGGAEVTQKTQKRKTPSKGFFCGFGLDSATSAFKNASSSN